MIKRKCLFSKFKNFRNMKYFMKIQIKLLSLYNDMITLNTSFADYMYSLSKIEYEDNKQDMERIRISVEAMSEVAEECANE